MQIRTEAEQTAVRRADAVANQARVLQAAHQVFAEQGLAAEIKDIADRAGVGVATIYRGFGSKSGLLQAAVEQASAAVSDSLAAAESAGDPIEGLRTMVIGLLGYAETYGWLIQASLAGEDVVTLRAEERAAKRRRVEVIVERALLAAGQQTPVDVARLLIEGTVVAVTLRARKQEARPAIEEIADSIVAMITSVKGTGGMTS